MSHSHKAEHADRHHGGPGSSQQNAEKAEIRAAAEQRPAGTPTNTPKSKVSGGGGERDSHHTHETSSKGGHSPADKAGSAER